MTSPAVYLAAGSRDCPICGGCGTRDMDGGTCRSCGASGFTPYPWILPEDGSVFPAQPWSREEDAIVTAAPSTYLAYAGYCAVYGPIRSYRSVRDHRLRRRENTHWRPLWSEADEDLIERAATRADAVKAYRRKHPGSELSLSDAAIIRKWGHMHRGK